MFWFRCGGIVRRRGRLRLTPWFFCLIIVMLFIVFYSSSIPKKHERQPPISEIKYDTLLLRKKLQKGFTRKHKHLITQTPETNAPEVTSTNPPKTPPITLPPTTLKSTPNTSMSTTVLQKKLDKAAKQKISTLTLPSIMNYLPHLAPYQIQLNPIRPDNIVVTPRIAKPHIAIGIPTVRRQSHFYLIDTLRSLLSGLTQAEKDRVVFIIYIGEKNIEYVKEIMKNILAAFLSEVKIGLIDIIAPPSYYFPELNNLPRTFGDTKERVKWRAKQNLDYAYLMMYAQNKAMYYMQLEDDVIAAPNYVTKIEAFAKNRGSNWFMLEFCRLGFIGKMFHATDLNGLVEFFLIFYKRKPNDWLLDHYVEVRVCSPEKGRKECNIEKKKIRIMSNPSLFQHVGKESSLKGKTQKLIDKSFRNSNKQQQRQIKENQFVAHNNPKAEVLTTCIEFSRFHLKSAYEGKNFAWVKTPKNDSLITFRFEKPIFMKSFLFRTGNHDHPGDILKYGVVEGLTKDKVKYNARAPTLKVDTGLHTVPLKDYVILGVFNEKGLVEGKVPTSLGEIAELRIRVTLDVMTNWVIISEFMIS